MFWKFGFHNASLIDSLLDKGDVALEAILDEDDLLQECKSQNTRLINYFQRVDVLQQLLAYVSGQIETEERGRCFKYPYVATEVLCSEIWSIVETCVSHSAQLLAPFWETVLDRSPEDMKTQMVIASHFAKINAVFLNKKPAEMLDFIQSQPSIIERILSHIETPSFVDLLVRIIQLDENPGVGVLDWLSAENLVGRLVDMLSPHYSPDIHTVVADVIKVIITTPSPGAGLSEGLQNSLPSNRFAMELAHPSRIQQLTGYMLNDFSVMDTSSLHSPTASESTTADNPALPNVDSATSSVLHSISVVIELIRKNNSDYSEPYIYHTMLNRLMQLQQHLQGSADEKREPLERAMKEMVDRLAVVPLGGVLEIMCDDLVTFQKYLRHPRTLDGATPTTIGEILPLTFERYRICELYAELLHCSNMALLNRSSQFSHLYDAQGRLQGGLAALEELAQLVEVKEQDRNEMYENCDEIEPAQELPVSSASHGSPSLLDSDEDMSDDEPGSSDDEAMEEIAMYDDGAGGSSKPIVESPPPQSPAVAPSPASPLPAESASAGADIWRRSTNSSSDLSITGKRSQEARSNSRRTTEGSLNFPLPVGERMKRRFLDLNVLSTLLDLFFEFPWNNFLHSVVYDFVHQILIGRVDGGMNRELVISLFRDARLMHRIVEGQKYNDIESAKPKGLRLGYMGHLTLISEDVVNAMDHFPHDLRQIITQLAPQPDWDEYVNGRYIETKQRDNSLLGGGKPVVAPMAARGATGWKVDEEDGAPTLSAPQPRNGTASPNGAHELKGEFRRTNSSRPVRRQNVDFGSASMEGGSREDNHELPQFAHYLAQEMQSSDHFSSGSDEDDEDGGWLGQTSFDLGRHPGSTQRQGNRRSLNGFNDSFAPRRSSENLMTVDPFVSSDDDDNFGPFSDAGNTERRSSDPFGFTTFSDEIEDPTFDTFADFGDFQTPADGELTPTGEGSGWSFASVSDGTGSEDSGSETSAGVLVPEPQTESRS